MAKELPYFKFEPSKWDNGNIQLCSFEAQGMFINLCCIYWSRIGDLPLKLAEQKLFKSNADAYAELMQEEIFAVNEGKIVINFLDEQLSNFGGLSETKSKAAKVRWDKVRENKEVNARALHMQSKSNAIREDKIREKEKKEEENKIYKSPYGDGRLHFLCKKHSEENPEKYSKAFYISFLEYWTAPIQKGNHIGKELWTQEKTFSLNSRLSTSYRLIWEGKDNESNSKQTIAPKTVLKTLELTEEQKNEMRRQNGLID